LPFCIQTKSISNNEHFKPHPLREQQQALNPKTGRLEVVFVDLEKVYPNHDNPMSEEYSFEELRAKHRGWSDYDWAAIRRREQEEARKVAEAAAIAKQSKPKAVPFAPKQIDDQLSKPKTVPIKGSIDDGIAANDENTPPSQEDMEKAKAARRARREEKANRTRKIKVMDVKEVRGETQTSTQKTMVFWAESLTRHSPNELGFSEQAQNQAKERCT
jgi:checkpoint serine/threonine-protein kinase